MTDLTVGSTAAYLAVPHGSSGPWPGVVAIHEAFGLNDDIRAHADRLAALGYLALAPDLLEGRFWMRCVRSMFRQIAAGSGARLRDSRRVPGLAGRARGLHRQDWGDRVLHGRRLRAPVRPAGGVCGGGRQLRHGPVRRRARAGRVVPGGRELRGQGHDGRLAPGAPRGRADRAGGSARREGVPGSGPRLHGLPAGRARPAARADPAAVRQGGGRGRLAADLRVLRSVPEGLTGPRRPWGPGAGRWRSSRCATAAASAASGR